MYVYIYIYIYIYIFQGAATRGEGAAHPLPRRPGAPHAAQRGGVGGEKGLQLQAP